jgi:hypothetical protein
MRTRDKEYWWLTDSIEDEKNSGLVKRSFVSESKDFNNVRAEVWRWYRSCVGNKALSVSAKLILWALCERWRWETCSSHDAIDYYAQMTGVNRKTAGRAIAELVERNIIWLVLEDERVRLKKSQTSGKKHFLLVGLSHFIRSGK